MFSTSWIISGLKPESETAFLIRSASILFELIASFPPLRITALPALRLRIAPSTVTFGLASYIMPITPIGTLTFSIFIPLGLVDPSMTSPIGSASPTSSSQDTAMPSILAGVRVSLSIIDSLMPFALALAMSSALAAKISSCLFLRICAISSRASFFC